VLHDFLDAHRAELNARCRFRLAQRNAAEPSRAVLEHGVPLFLEQLIGMLRVELASDAAQSRELAVALGATATRHGLELLEHGYRLDEVVHGYGDLCQAITELAFERAVPVGVAEFRILNRCLDSAIADAVTEFSRGRDALRDEKRARTVREQIGSLAHEVRNHVHTATLALGALKAGGSGVGGATGGVLDRSLLGLRALVDRALLEARTSAGTPPRLELLALAGVMAEVHNAATLQARARGCEFSAARVERDLTVHADRELLLCALENLLQNAFKFTAPRTQVSMTGYAAGERVFIEVADHCGGLPPGRAQRLFSPFVQAGGDRSGAGLGLAIARRAVEASDGRLSVRDVPGTGCVFTIDLPRRFR
jgi:hypothetical protein